MTDPNLTPEQEKALDRLVDAIIDDSIEQKHLSDDPTDFESAPQ